MEEVAGGPCCLSAFQPVGFQGKRFDQGHHFSTCLSSWRKRQMDGGSRGDSWFGELAPCVWNVENLMVCLELPRLSNPDFGYPSIQPMWYKVAFASSICHGLFALNRDCVEIPRRNSSYDVVDPKHEVIRPCTRRNGGMFWLNDPKRKLSRVPICNRVFVKGNVGQRKTS